MCIALTSNTYTRTVYRHFKNIQNAWEYIEQCRVHCNDNIMRQNISPRFDGAPCRDERRLVAPIGVDDRRLVPVTAWLKGVSDSDCNKRTVGSVNA